jgi:hypothetical protein
MILLRTVCVATMKDGYTTTQLTMEGWKRSGCYPTNNIRSTINIYYRWLFYYTYIVFLIEMCHRRLDKLMLTFKLGTLCLFISSSSEWVPYIHLCMAVWAFCVFAVVWIRGSIFVFYFLWIGYYVFDFFLIRNCVFILSRLRIVFILFWIGYCVFIHISMRNTIYV